MKISATGFQRHGPASIEDAVVAVDEYHRKQFGMRLLGSNCVIVKNINDANNELAAGNYRKLATIDSRIESNIASCLRFSEISPQVCCQLDLIFPSEELVALYEALQSTPARSSLAIVAIGFRAGVVHLSIRHASPRDPGADILIAGILIGAEQEYPVSHVHAMKDDSVVELTEKLLSVLQAVDLSDAPDAPRREISDSTRIPNSPDDSGEKIKHLEDQLVATRTELDSLQRKYTALANSRLGRLTLKRWDTRRKGSK